MTNQRMEQLKAFAQSQGWQWQAGKTIPHGEQYVISSADASVRVNFWPGRGTIQVQGAASALKDSLEALLAGAAAPAMISDPHIGIDESGKGDWFGPLVVAAVFVTPATATRLQQAGVRDSKTVERGALPALAARIEQLVPAEQRLVMALAPQEYNRRYAMQPNINLLLATLYAEIAAQLQGRVNVPLIVCDQFAQQASRLDNAFAAAGLPAPRQQHHAETASIAVAAASVLASAAFGAALADLGSAAGLDKALPRGASDLPALEHAAQAIIAREGPVALGHYAKLNFAPVRALLG